VRAAWHGCNTRVACRFAGQTVMSALPEASANLAWSCWGITQVSRIETAPPSRPPKFRSLKCLAAPTFTLDFYPENRYNPRMRNKKAAPVPPRRSPERLVGNLGNVSKARLFFPDGRIEHYDDQRSAYSVYVDRL
jgi:hypothetical protein